MRTLILGAKGQLGRDLMQVFAAAGEVRGYDLPELDVADAAALETAAHAFGPDLIVNAAAYTNVDGAEDDLTAAFLGNETGARNAADIAAYHGIPIVYFSTDYVFDGSKGAPYTPEDPAAPLNVYGRSKAAGEMATRHATPRHFILRTAWLYGPGGNNFPEKMLQAAAQRPELRVVEDEVGSPTHTWDLAEMALALARTTAYGTYHTVNTGACTRYDFARQVLCFAGVTTPVHPCSSSEFTFKAARPRYSVLDTTALTEACGYRPRAWVEALAHFMERRG